MPIYKRSADNLWYKMQADPVVGVGGGLAEAGVGLDNTQMGISLGGGTVGVWGAVLTSGPMTIGATLVVGVDYHLHATAGLIGLFSDLASGNYITKLGYATTTAFLTVSINATGLTLA